jgi:hypothetical protein
MRSVNWSSDRIERFRLEGPVPVTLKRPISMGAEVETVMFAEREERAVGEVLWA